MPVTPWLQGFQDYVFFQVLAEAALSMAMLTGAPPGTRVGMAGISFNHLRPPTVDSGTLLARARTVSSGRTFGYSEVDVEDGSGRLVGHATGTAVFRVVPVPPGWPGSNQADEAVETPTYSTLDPYLRPLPAGVGIVPEELWDRHDGLALARMSVAGELPMPPMAALFGVRFLDWDEGYNQMSMPATEWLGRENREVAPGVLALLALLGLGGTTALNVERRRLQVGIVDDSVSFYREVPCDGRQLLATGRITHRPGDFIVSSVEITDPDGYVAVGHRTSVFLEPRPVQPPKRQRSLLTVLFTDLVGSTGKAEALGDERWSHLLQDHYRLARRQLEIHDGREVKTTGDGFLATFESPTRAIQCARAIRDGGRRLGLELRAGIHAGECEVSGGDITGLAVHVAARVQSAAEAGEILVSSTVRDLTTGSGFHLVERGVHEHKGSAGSGRSSSWRDKRRG